MSGLQLPNRKKYWCVVTAAILLSVLAGCPQPEQPFNSAVWKSGDPSCRGAMISDILSSRLLVGKTKEQARALPGNPDYRDEPWYGYKVVTIPRCSMWECRLDVRTGEVWLSPTHQSLTSADVTTDRESNMISALSRTKKPQRLDCGSDQYTNLHEFLSGDGHPFSWLIFSLLSLEPSSSLFSWQLFLPASWPTS